MMAPNSRHPPQDLCKALSVEVSTLLESHKVSFPSFFPLLRYHKFPYKTERFFLILHNHMGWLTTNKRYHYS
jgi:hypothetical protein